MKVLNILARICGIFLVFLSGALLIIMFLSKAYLGDGLGLFKILRTAQIITQHYAGLVDEGLSWTAPWKVSLKSWATNTLYISTGKILKNFPKRRTLHTPV